jgi:hypothetical protein
VSHSRVRPTLAAANRTNHNGGMAGTEELLVLLAIGFLLCAVLRWSFGDGRVTRKLHKARDYGLLREVATTPSDRAARFVQDRLRRGGIRATTAPDDDTGAVHVLVFPADARAAADLLLTDDPTDERADPPAA